MTDIKHEVYSAGFHITDQAFEYHCLNEEELLSRGWIKVDGGYDLKDE